MLAPFQNFIASYPVGKTTLTSFGLRSWIVSLSLTYPASRWIIFHCTKLSMTSLYFHLWKVRDSNSRAISDSLVSGEVLSSTQPTFLVPAASTEGLYIFITFNFWNLPANIPALISCNG